MARARTLRHEDYSVLALIGDGAMSGGLSFEGLNNAGASQEPLIVILNDNGMSINPNVGAVDSHLSQIRSKPAYYHFKKWYRGLFGQHPMENPLYRFNHKVKTSLKKALWPGSTLFEDMGFTYLGPIDGHDLDRLVHVLAWARELQCPVVVHVKTVKGRGYSFAEQNPDKFHGVGPFVRDGPCEEERGRRLLCRVRQDAGRLRRGGRARLRHHRRHGGRHRPGPLCQRVPGPVLRCGHR